MTMKKLAIGLLTIILLAGGLTLLLSRHAAPTDVLQPMDNSQSDSDSSSLPFPTTNTNCLAYYNGSGVGTDTLSMELADFSDLHPLSDFLCGANSNATSTTLADGKTLYFVAPITRLGCGSGGCTYYPLLEEKSGLVRHIRGFTSYSDYGSTSTASASQDADGSLFGFLTFDSKAHTVSAYAHENAQCGTTNTYAFSATDTPVLISASDSCLPGNGILYPTK